MGRSGCTISSADTDILVWVSTHIHHILVWAEPPSDLPKHIHHKISTMGKATAAAASKPKAKQPTSGKRTVAKGSKKQVAKKKKVPPMPTGWPVSSKLSYPTPREATAEMNNDKKGIMDLLDSSDEDDDGTPCRPKSATAANYLKPGNLLQRSCNGSDVFLRKRAVQSTSMTFPSAVNTNKGAPTRFLIVFPGRMSLKAPPPPPTATKNSVARDDGANIKDEELKNEGGDEGETKKRKAFAPTHPPRLLGKLVSLGGDKRRMELRIPLPKSEAASSPETQVANNSAVNNQRVRQNQLVMSGRAIPLTGKYMALSFKRTGGGKDSSSSAKDKKTGTGCITCKDVFRSVIALGDGKLSDIGDVKATASKGSDDDGARFCNHYGSSERTLDGGGRAGKSLKGGAPVAAAASAPVKRKHSASSEEAASESDASGDDDDDADDTNYGSDAGSDGEFIPTAGKKKGGSTTGGANMRKAPPVRKRVPRRSAANEANISYVDESSDVDMVHSDDVASDATSREDEEEKYKSKERSIVKKPNDRKGIDEICISSDEDEVVHKPKGKPRIATEATKAKETSNDIIDVDDSDDGEDHEAIARAAKERLSAMMSSPEKSSPLSPSRSPTKSSPISRGRSKKKKSPAKTTPAALNFDDDEPFSFL